MCRTRVSWSDLKCRTISVMVEMMVGMRLASVEGKVLEVSLRMTCPYITCSSVLHPSPCTATSTSYSTAHFKPLYSTTKQTWTPAVSSHTCRSILCPNCQLYRSTLCPNCQKCAVNSVPELSNMQVNSVWEVSNMYHQLCARTVKHVGELRARNVKYVRSTPCPNCQTCTVNSVPELPNM